MKPLLALCLLTLILAATGCGEKQQPAAATGESLDGRTFLSTKVLEGSEERELVDGTRIRLVFTADGLSASAGCNTLHADFRLDGDRLRISGMGGTEMGCEPELMKQDEWLEGFLTADPTWRLAGDALVLSSGDTEIHLVDRKVAEPDRPLEGTRWKVSELITGSSDNGTVSSMPQGVRAHMTFGDDGRVTGNAGCNSFTARFTQEGGQITFSELTATRMACTGAAGKVERIVFEVLEAKVDAKIDAARLTLIAPSGKGIGLHEK